MASSKGELKTVLLLSPHRLQEDHIVLESLHITKAPEITNRPGTAKVYGAARASVPLQFETCELNNTELRRYYSQLPGQAIEVLGCFTEVGLYRIREHIQKRHTSQRAGVPFESYYKNAMTRKLHELLEQMKPFAGLLKWYHKLPGDKGNFRTGPCTFSTYRPQLHFEVNQEEVLVCKPWVYQD